MRKISPFTWFSLGLLGLLLGGLAYILIRQPLLMKGDTIAGTEDLTETVEPYLIASPLPPDAPLWDRGPEPRIAFVSEQDGNDEIYSMRPDGSDMLRLTTNNALDLLPRWSPDASRISWLSEQDGQRDLYVMPASGGDPLRLTNTAEIEDDPKWSPDGSLIAFSVPPLDEYGYKSGTPGKLFVVSADASSAPRLLSEELLGDFDWTSDGSTLLLMASPVGGQAIITVPLDGSEGEWYQFSEGPLGMNVDPSPTGSMMAYTIVDWSSRSEGVIYGFNRSASTYSRLMNAQSNIRKLEWSPLGTHLSYTVKNYTYSPQQYDLYAVEYESGDAQFVAHLGETQHFDWSPDETQFVMEIAAAGEQPYLATIALDGSGLRQIVDEGRMPGECRKLCVNGKP